MAYARKCYETYMGDSIEPIRSIVFRGVVFTVDSSGLIGVEEIGAVEIKPCKFSIEGNAGRVVVSVLTGIIELGIDGTTPGTGGKEPGIDDGKTPGIEDGKTPGTLAAGIVGWTKPPNGAAPPINDGVGPLIKDAVGCDIIGMEGWIKGVGLVEIADPNGTNGGWFIILGCIIGCCANKLISFDTGFGGWGRGGIIVLPIVDGVWFIFIICVGKGGIAGGVLFTEFNRAGGKTVGISKPRNFRLINLHAIENSLMSIFPSASVSAKDLNINFFLEII